MSCPTIKKKLQGILKGKKKKNTQFEETEQASEPDMTGDVGITGEFKTVIRMLRVLMDKADSI